MGDSSQMRQEGVAMAGDKPPTTPHQRSRIKEIVVEGTIEALNAGIEQNGVDIDDIVLIRFEPARAVAIGDYKAQYHVLYRA
jgi:hypothetical protein